MADTHPPDLPAAPDPDPAAAAPPPPTVGRRLFVAGATGAAALLATQRVPGAWATPGAWPDNPFTLGVASGDPTPTGVVLWTRLAPRPLEPDGGMPARSVPVDWEVATGPRLHEVVRRGRAVASPARGHAVHVEVDGLDPGRHYWYRFRAGGHLSRLGRTKTCADPRLPLSRLTLAFVSCQHYEKGYYTAYRHLAEDDLDVVLHLGDYIYENAASRNQPRRHVGDEPTDLAGYRVRHALYKTDRDLQTAHARHPFVATWDDHEAENDYAGRHPVEGGDPATFLRRRAAAYRAYWEHMPLRRPPQGASMPVYRRLRFGDLVEVNVLDTRQYRDDQPCQQGGSGGGRVVVCPERVDPRRTILGDHQRRWLLRGLDRSQARWNVLAQQVVMAERDLHPGPGRSWWSDAWDGYAADRDRILRFLWERQPANPVVLTGDIHSFSMNDLHLPGRAPDAPVVATELVGTSISSGAGNKSNGFRKHLKDNPHIRFFESRLRGYTRCTVIRERWYADLRVIDTIEHWRAPVRTLARFVVENGRPGVEQV
jgi:alkaline phosphatase D